ncbi:hypothetical protein [Actinomadura fibrosa]|uniref:Uncharacterized protein n=1 Tax=Actinomadura fibrosa TaxID=111802 RepID=A0ABW2X8U6_9ACTN|nr:hypothetical protein [Actinomadura fibrosa]
MSPLVGVGCAFVSYFATAASWGDCGNGPDAGGAFSVNVLGIAGLIVMPSVAVVCGALAFWAHGVLCRSTDSDIRSDLGPTLIVMVGAFALIALVLLWISWGSPPDGYCEGMSLSG